MADTPKRPEADLKNFSCLSCRQRKVKCDRRAPCQNCVKAERPCSFVAPVRGKRKRTKPPKETLHARVKRYEEMLKAYGAKIEPFEDGEESGSEMESGSSVTPERVEAMPMRKQPSRASAEAKPKFIMKEGASRYFDRYVFLFIRTSVMKTRFSFDTLSAIWTNLTYDVRVISFHRPRCSANASPSFNIQSQPTSTMSGKPFHSNQTASSMNRASSLSQRATSPMPLSSFILQCHCSRRSGTSTKIALIR